MYQDAVLSQPRSEFFPAISRHGARHPDRASIASERSDGAAKNPERHLPNIGVLNLPALAPSAKCEAAPRTEQIHEGTTVNKYHKLAEFGSGPRRQYGKHRTDFRALHGLRPAREQHGSAIGILSAAPSDSRRLRARARDPRHRSAIPASTRQPSDAFSCSAGRPRHRRTNFRTRAVVPRVHGPGMRASMPPPHKLCTSYRRAHMRSRRRTPSGPRRRSTEPRPGDGEPAPAKPAQVPNFRSPHPPAGGQVWRCGGVLAPTGPSRRARANDCNALV